jgi:hypothetical protein
MRARSRSRTHTRPLFRAIASPRSS